MPVHASNVYSGCASHPPPISDQVCPTACRLSLPLSPLSVICSSAHCLSPALSLVLTTSSSSTCLLPNTNPPSPLLSLTNPVRAGDQGLAWTLPARGEAPLGPYAQSAGHRLRLPRGAHTLAERRNSAARAPRICLAYQVADPKPVVAVVDDDQAPV